MGSQRQGRRAHVACSPPGGGKDMLADRRLRAAERDIRARHEHLSVSHRLNFASAQYVPRCACLRGAPARSEVPVIAASKVRRHRHSRRQAPQGGQAVCSQEAERDRRQAERADEHRWVSRGLIRICRCSDSRHRRRSPHGSARSARVGPGSPAEAADKAAVTEKQSTTTTLSSSLDPSTVGQAVTYTATVNATAATGSVTFEDTGTSIPDCGDQIVSSGAATCTLSGYAAASAHAITATYNGDGNYVGSTSSVLNQVVSRASTSTTLTSSMNPSMVGQPVTYTATVSPAAATGTVSFDEAGTPIAGCTAQPVISGDLDMHHLRLYGRG